MLPKLPLCAMSSLPRQRLKHVFLFQISPWVTAQCREHHDARELRIKRQRIRCMYRYNEDYCLILINWFFNYCNQMWAVLTDLLTSCKLPGAHLLHVHYPRVLLPLSRHTKRCFLLYSPIHNQTFVQLITQLSYDPSIKVQKYCIWHQDWSL
jgi:hypothetical protein